MSVSSTGQKKSIATSQVPSAPAGKASSHDGFGGLTADIGAGAIHLGGILSGEGTAAVRAPAAICVNDDLAAGQASIAVGATNYKAAGGVEVEDGLVIKVLGRHDGLDNMLHQVLR